MAAQPRPHGARGALAARRPAGRPDRAAGDAGRGDALGQGGEARDYLVALRERLLNPWLAHRLADIAANHETKKARRLAPVVALARERVPALAQPWLRGALAASAVLDAKESSR